MTKSAFEVSENMMMWAFRYALGRRTGAVTDVIMHLKNNWKKLTPQTRDQIKREIKNAISMEMAGDDCDIESWRELL